MFRVLWFCALKKLQVRPQVPLLPKPHHLIPPAMPGTFLLLEECGGRRGGGREMKRDSLNK